MKYKKFIWNILAIAMIVTLSCKFSESTSVQSNKLREFYIPRNLGENKSKFLDIPTLELPIKRIIIGHTGDVCNNKDDCLDIFNFLIDDEGIISEGRGFRFQGQHTKNLDATEYNSIGICIAFIGNYESEPPNDMQTYYLKLFIDIYVFDGFIAEDYMVFIQDDLKYFNIKATALNEFTKTLDNYHPLYKIYRREEWNAQRSRGDPLNFDRVMDWVLIGHTVTPLCNDLASCMTRARSLQAQAFSLQFGDIHYNIMFGGNGYALEGRGWDLVGAHARGFNSISIGVGTIGDFNTVPPNDAILNAMLRVYDDAMALGKLTDDYKIFGRADFGGPGPGTAFMNIIRTWPRYGNGTNLITTSTSSTTSTSTTSNEDPTTTNTLTTTTRDPSDNFITREEWGAAPPASNDIPKLSLPIRRIIIAHTAGDSCLTLDECIATVKSLQFHNPSLDDIPYNFLVGGDGRIYEGRGYEYEGQHTHNLDATEYNSIGICIAFIGDYSTETPNQGQINALTRFIDSSIQYRDLAIDHIIVSQDDLKYFAHKATALNEITKTLQNYRPLYKIYRREEWNAQRSRGDPLNFDRVMDWVLIGHTVTPLCNDLASCMTRARSLQAQAFSLQFGDIHYNIMFGGNGYALEGRGWDLVGAHARGFNSISIGVGTIGDFNTVPPNDAILNAMLQVYDDAMALGKLTDDYKIFGRADFGGPGPGNAFMNIIRTWCRYGNRTNTC